MKAIVINPDYNCILDLYDWNDIKRSIGGGYLQPISLREDLIAYIDEEGKMKNFPYNPMATRITKILLKEDNRGLLPNDHIVGTMVLCGVKPSENPEEGYIECDVPDDVIQRFDFEEHASRQQSNA